MPAFPLRTELCRTSSCSAAPHTSTVKLAVAESPDPSLAEQLTVVTPIGKVEPDGGVHEMVMVPTPPLAVTLKVATAPAGLVAKNATPGTGTLSVMGVGVDPGHAVPT